MMRISVCVFLALSLMCHCQGFGFQQEGIIKNGNFKNWTDGKPNNWSANVGAGRPVGKLSTLEPLTGGGVSLSGDNSSQRWQFLSQDLKVKPGQMYRLNFSASAQGLKLEPRQFDNCYVGVFSKTRSGKIVDQNFKAISSAEFRNESIIFEGSKDNIQSVWVFLSKTGKLNVRSLDVVEIDPSSSFDLLIEDMDRNYSYFEHKQIDWGKLTQKYRRRATDATDKKAFTSVVLEMLAEMDDDHIWLMDKGKRIKAASKEHWPAVNYNISFVRKQLNDVRSINRYCLTGRTEDGFGYVLIDSLFQVDEKTFNQMCSDICRLFDAPGLIVDCRTNGGGSEPVGQKIAGMFVEENLAYAQQKYRSGPKHSDFTEPVYRYLKPWRFKKDDKAYLKPIVCLQGPGAVSSGEGFVLMMKAIPHCRTLGQPTAGSSGNPAPVRLPNGVEVWYSRWVAMDAEGNAIEDVGIQPDQVVKHSGKNDPTFSKAIQILRKQTN